MELCSVETLFLFKNGRKAYFLAVNSCHFLAPAYLRHLFFHELDGELVSVPPYKVEKALLVAVVPPELKALGNDLTWQPISHTHS